MDGVAEIGKARAGLLCGTMGYMNEGRITF